MANNEQILNEVFFKKKKSYTDTLKDKQAQYTPVGKTDDIKSLFNGKSSDSFVVSDTDEVKKRIIGALGMAMGNNTVKNMANKAIKSFPIIMSNDLTPETAVMVKNAMEEQYASWIDLLVSNQIINLTDYDAGGDNGNIAIQALNKLDGTDFGRGRLARQAQTGSLTIDDIMKNNPGWQFIRTNEGYTSGNSILDALFENAIIIPSEYTNNITEGLYNLSKFDLLTEETKSIISEEPVPRLYSDSINDLVGQDARKLYQDYKFGYTKRNDGNGDYYKKEFTKLITPSAITASENSLNDSLDRSIAEILSGKSAKNNHEIEISKYLKDRFEKASYLLTSGYISGAEYISYLTERLGIPVAQSVRQDLLLQYRAENLIFKNQRQWIVKSNGSVVNNRKGSYSNMLHSIENNEKYFTNKIAPRILGLSAKDVLTLSIGAVGGAGLGAGAGMAINAGIITGIAATPIIWPIIAGAAVGSIGGTIVNLINKKRAKQALRIVGGWERVEQLIDELDLNRQELYQHAKDLESKLNNKSKEEFEEADIEAFNSKRFKDFNAKMESILNTVTVNEEITNLKGYRYTMSDDAYDRAFDTLKALDEAVMCDKELFMELNEAKYIINTKKPSDIIVKQTKYDNKDVASVVPSFGTRDVVAYGSVEYDRRDLKDRKYNEPLILTIKFKERYSDGKYNDNELTAVIGILGVITRVPSDEMTNILKANAEGKTLSNFFGGNESNNSKDLIGNVISSFMNSKYAEKLPVSGKVWSNLEKVSALALANKLAGNNNGNISNAHLVFSQREIDNVKNEIGVDYLKNAKLSAQLMKKYSAFMLMVCNDAMQYIYSFNDLDAISWDDAPYSAYMGKSNSDQLLSAFTQYNRTRL